MRYSITVSKEDDSIVNSVDVEMKESSFNIMDKIIEMLDDNFYFQCDKCGLVCDKVLYDGEQTHTYCVDCYQEHRGIK